MVWSQLELEQAHIAYACVGIFSTIFSLVSLFVKERLYIGEATVATIAGLILGPYCLDWFNPVTWGNSDHITLEISRIVLCIQIVAVAVELPRKYMKKHWLSVAILLLPVMTCGWLVVGLFIWVLIPNFNFTSALLVSACVTATDPVLAAAVVGKGKFAERVPGHLRNLLSAESGCNDGMAFPFIFLSLNLIFYHGQGGKIVKNWILLTILWECLFGVVLGIVLGLSLRHAVAFAEKKNLIDRESFLAIFVFLAFNSAGVGSMLGVDDLLVSFAAGTAFGWNGSFASKTEESHVSTVIDLLLNLSFFVYFGAIIPWPQFNNGALGLNCWRLIILAVVIIFLRRLPAVVALKPFTPDIKTWREAFFCGHFGPIGVGAIFASILARKDLEAHYTDEETPLMHLPSPDHPHYQLIASIWPIVCFVVITSIVVHGSSVAVLTLGKRLNRMAITMSFTTTTTQDQGPTWMSRLQKLDRVSTSFSLHRIDTAIPKDEEADKIQKTNTIETSGVKIRPAGGAKRKKHKKKKRNGPGARLKKTLSRATTQDVEELRASPITERQRPQAEFLQLRKTTSAVTPTGNEEEVAGSPTTGATLTKEEYDQSESSSPSIQIKGEKDSRLEIPIPGPPPATRDRRGSIPTTAFQEGSRIIIEDQNGEIIETLPIKDKQVEPINRNNEENMSIHSLGSFRRKMSQYSSLSDSSSIQSESPSDIQSITGRLSNTLSGSNKKRAYYKKNDPHHRKVYAHQIDDLIVIENEEGEIIRRYRVNRHSNPNKTRSRSSTIMGRALSLVGIKPKVSENASPTPSVPENNITSDLEKNERDTVLVPDNGIQHPNSPLQDSKIEMKIEGKLNDILAKSDIRSAKNLLTAPNKERKPSIVLEESGSPDNDSSEQSEQSEDSETDEEDDDLNETEIERRRRLAALGHIPADKHDDDEEE